MSRGFSAYHLNYLVLYIINSIVLFYISQYFGLRPDRIVVKTTPTTKKQGTQEDMRKIHLTRQFFLPRVNQGHFIEKTKNLFLDMVQGSVY